MIRNRKIKPKILIVDDSPINRDILSNILGEEYEIIEAEDGAEAIAILEKLRLEIALVFLDIYMPKIDGFGVLEVMKEKKLVRRYSGYNNIFGRFRRTYRKGIRNGSDRFYRQTV